MLFWNGLEGEHNPHHCRGDDEEDGMNLFQGGVLHTYKDGHCQGDGGPVGVAGEGALQPLGGAKEGDPGYLEHGGGDEGHRGCPKAIEYPVHHLGLAEFLQKLRNDENDNNGGEDEPQGGDHPAQHPTTGETYIGGHIHPHGAGGGFRDSDHVGQLAGGEPAGAVAQVGEEGDGGQSPSHGEESHPAELKEKLEIDSHAFSPPFAARTARPIAPERMTRNTGEVATFHTATTAAVVVAGRVTKFPAAARANTRA